MARKSNSGGETRLICVIYMWDGLQYNGFLLVNHTESRRFVYDTFEGEQPQMYHVPARMEIMNLAAQNAPSQFSALQTRSPQAQIFALQNFLLRPHEQIFSIWRNPIQATIHPTRYVPTFHTCSTSS